MAMVGAVQTTDVKQRRPEDVVEELKGDDEEGKKQRQSLPKPHNKRVFASLEADPDEFTQELAAEMVRRHPERKRLVGGLVDAEPALMNALKRWVLPLFANIVLILDLFHVLRYLWKAANCIHAEGTVKAEEWVTHRLRRILNGEVARVIRGLRQSATKRKKAKKKWKALETAADYFDKRRQYMRYDQYLAMGPPIATGVIESTCRHLAKDRMELSGMRWSIPGGEAMLRVRSLVLNDEFDAFWDFHIDLEQARLIP